MIDIREREERGNVEKWEILGKFSWVKIAVFNGVIVAVKVKQDRFLLWQLISAQQSIYCGVFLDCQNNATNYNFD